jgi:hypothetical protein
MLFLFIIAESLIFNISSKSFENILKTLSYEFLSFKILLILISSYLSGEDKSLTEGV